MQEHFAATGPRKTAAQIQAQQRDLMSKLPEVWHHKCCIDGAVGAAPVVQLPSTQPAATLTRLLCLQGTSIDSRVLDVATSLNMVRGRAA
jgi:hypothetical protein